MPQDPPDYFGLVLVALVNLMFNGEHRLSFKNGVKFFFLCVSFVVVLISCGAWHLGLTLQAHARAADDGLPRICVFRRYPVERSEPRSG